MAKNNIMKIALYGLGGYLVYQVGVKGGLGSGVQQALSGLRGVGKDVTTPIGSGPSSSAGSSGGFGDNPNFWNQMAEWQALRKARGENPYDWSAFRTHLMAIGAPDPGYTAPAQFYSGA